MSNWVSVKDKLPETRQDVLFFISRHYGGVKAKQGVYVANYENEYGRFGPIFISPDKGWHELHTVSHWQPLPEPPVK